MVNGCQDYNDSHQNTIFYKHLVDIYKRHIQKKRNARKKLIKEKKSTIKTQTKIPLKKN